MVKAEINVTVVVTNRNFSESMEDPMSTAFKVFVEIFIARVRETRLRRAGGNVRSCG